MCALGGRQRATRIPESRSLFAAPSATDPGAAFVRTTPASTGYPGSPIRIQRRTGQASEDARKASGSTDPVPAFAPPVYKPFSNDNAVHKKSLPITGQAGLYGHAGKPLHPRGGGSRVTVRRDDGNANSHSAGIPRRHGAHRHRRAHRRRRLGAEQAGATLRHARPGVSLSWLEDLYRDEFTWDHVGYAAHCINCVGNCAFRIYVKDGIVLREEQLAEYPQINPDTPDANPRGCQKGAIHSAAMYEGDRLRYPMKRAGTSTPTSSRRASASTSMR